MIGSISPFSAENDAFPKVTMTLEVKIFTVFFIYAAIAALSVQFIVLPYLFPELHAGDGLLKGLDSVPFHRRAAIMAEDIQREGWVNWEFRPTTNSPIGIAGAVYALTTSKPWVLIPINASLHAGAGLLLFLILMKIGQSKKMAIYATIPFVVFPSSLTWVSQIHKDGYSIFGCLMALYGIILLYDANTIRKKAKVIILIWVGVIFCWIARIYLMEVFKLLLFVFLVVYLGMQTYFLYKERIIMKQFAGAVVFSLFVLSGPMIPGVPDLFPRQTETGDHGVRESNTPQNRKMQNSQLKGHYETESAFSKAVSRLGGARLGFGKGHPDAGTNIDADLYFENFTELFLYTPRLLQILFFAPFPSKWLEEGKTIGGTPMRIVTMVEMVFSYFTFLFLPCTLWYWRRSHAMWILVVFCILYLLPVGLFVSNVGALYRMRYMGFMSIVCLGIFGVLVLFNKLPIIVAWKKTREIAEKNFPSNQTIGPK